MQMLTELVYIFVLVLQNLVTEHNCYSFEHKILKYECNSSDLMILEKFQATSVLFIGLYFLFLLRLSSLSRIKTRMPAWFILSRVTAASLTLVTLCLLLLANHPTNPLWQHESCEQSWFSTISPRKWRYQTCVETSIKAFGPTVLTGQTLTETFESQKSAWPKYYWGGVLCLCHSKHSQSKERVTQGYCCEVYY